MLMQLMRVSKGLRLEWTNWVLVGGDIDDTYSSGTSNFGVSVSLSGDGATLVAGGWTGQSKGIVNIYKYEILWNCNLDT